MLTLSQTDALKRVSSKLGIDPAWLDSLIAFETANTYSPVISNRNSSAKGLIQFIDATAKSLGYESSQDLVYKHSTFESQIEGPVYKYLKQYLPFRTKQSLFMSVFYPAYRNVPPETAFPDSVKRVNPGIQTVADYMNKADKKKKFELSGILLLAFGLAAYLYLKNRGDL